MKITLILYNVYIKFVILLFKEEICDNVLSNVMLLSKFCSFMFTVQFVRFTYIVIAILILNLILFIDYTQSQFYLQIILKANSIYRLYPKQILFIDYTTSGFCYEHKMKAPRPLYFYSYFLLKFMRYSFENYMVEKKKLIT